MALESATNASELVATNPTSTDLVKSADDHIRMIKRILKDGFQGHFTSLTPVRALTSVDGTWFTYNGNAYAIYTSDLTESLPSVIKLTNNKIAIQLTAAPVARDTLLPTAATQRRYPRIERVSGTSFDLSAVNAAFDGTPIQGDIALVIGTNFAEARIFTTSWGQVDKTNYGYQAFIGTVAALSLTTPLGIIDRIRAQSFELLSATHLEVNSPDGFGPDNLRYWFGLNTNVVDNNGKIAYNSLAKSNAIEWKSMTSGTINGDSTPVDGGAVVTDLGLATAYLCEIQSYSSNPTEENARIAFGVDGTFTVLAYGDVITGSPVGAPYVTTPSSSTGFLYEVKFEKLSGDAVDGATNVYMQLNTVRQVGIIATRDTVGTAVKTASIKIYVRKIGDGASEKTRTLTLTSRAVVNAGIEP